MSNLHHSFPWSWSSTHPSASSVFDSMSLMTQTFCCWIYTVLQRWAVLMSQWPVQFRKKGKRNSKKKPILFLFCNEWFPHYALRLLVIMTLLKLLRHKTRTSLRLRVFHLFISDFGENNWRNQGQSKISSDTCSIDHIKTNNKTYSCETVAHTSSKPSPLLWSHAGIEVQIYSKHCGFHVLLLKDKTNAKDW